MEITQKLTNVYKYLLIIVPLCVCFPQYYLCVFGLLLPSYIRLYQAINWLLL